MIDNRAMFVLSHCSTVMAPREGAETSASGFSTRRLSLGT